MALSPKTSCSIQVGFGNSFFFFFFCKIETKFDADSLLLKICHIGGKKIAGSLKHNLTKTHWT